MRVFKVEYFEGDRSVFNIVGDKSVLGWYEGLMQFVDREKVGIWGIINFVVVIYCIL